MLRNAAPSWALLLEGSTVDAATLATLLVACPSAAEESWWRVDDIHGPGCLLLPENSTQFVVPEGRGLPLCDVEIKSNHIEWRRRRASDEGPENQDSLCSWPLSSDLEPKRLLFAQRPTPTGADPDVDSVLFVVDASSPAAGLLFNRLLRLGFGSAQVSTWRGNQGEQLFVEVTAPPRYLLLRARDEPDAGMCVFTEASAGVFVEWSFQFPLERAATIHVQREGVRALIGRDGTWQILPQSWKSKSIYDVVVPTLNAVPNPLKQIDGKHQFEVRLRLLASAPVDPELWLVDAKTFERLGTFFYTASPDDVSRLSVARLGDDESGVMYVIRERRTPSQEGVGVALNELFDVDGYSRLAGTENFFIPTGRRLLPRMRRAELRQHLPLDENALIVLEEDGDGLRLTMVQELDEKPLSSWIEFIATDRRRELDRILEDAVLSFPAVRIDRPRSQKVAKPKRPPPKRKKAPVSIPPLHNPRKPESNYDDTVTVSRDAEALLATARPLENLIVAGGHADPSTWNSLGLIREALEDDVQAAACLESALFFAGEPALRMALDPADDSRNQMVESLLRCRRQAHRSFGSDEEELVELLTRQRHIASEASFLGALVVQMLCEQNSVARSSLAQIISVFRDRELPVSRKLAWTVLLAAHLVSNDSLGLTRAKEVLVGGVNEKGLNEAYDLPRFVRLELALESDDDDVRKRTVHDQLSILESLWETASGGELEGYNVDGAYLRAQFGVGFARLGAMGNARALVRPLEEELPAHDAPNRALLSLYLSRLAYAATHSGTTSSEVWREEVASVLAGIDNVKVRRTVEWLRKRSAWLNPDKEAPPPPWIRPDFERLLQEAEQETEQDGGHLAATVVRAFQLNELYDYELSSAVERMVAAALATGIESTVADVLDAAQQRLEKIQILSHRAIATGACIRAAATLGDLSRVDAFLSTVIEISQAPNVPSMRSLLGAVHPALQALRRLGASQSGIQFLQAIERIEVRSRGEQLRLMAAVSDGLMNLEVSEKPMAIVDDCIDILLDEDLDHVSRFEAALAIVASLHHWPLAARAQRCARLLENLARFRDTFTTSAFFSTHRILLCEAIIDAMCDDKTLKNDRVHAFLDAEEQVLRRVINADWSALCGR